MMVPAASGGTPLPLRSPCLVLAGGDQQRTGQWLDTVARLWADGSGFKVIRVAAGPEEARASRARKALLAEVLTDTVSDHLAQRQTQTLLIVDLTGAYEHTGRDDDEEAADMGHSVVEAIKAARQSDGLPLIIVADHLGDLPDSLAGFETVIAGGLPTKEMTERFARLPRRSSRPATAAPQGYVWLHVGDDNGWTPAPVSDGRAPR